MTDVYTKFVKIYNDAVQLGKALDVSKLTVNGTGARKIDIPKTTQGTKKWVENLPVLSDNYETYALAMQLLGPEFQHYAAQYLQLYGGAKILRTTKATTKPQITTAFPVVVGATTPALITAPTNVNVATVTKTRARTPRTPKTPTVRAPAILAVPGVAPVVAIPAAIPRPASPTRGLAPLIQPTTGGETVGYTVQGITTKVIDTPTGPRLATEYDQLTNEQLLNVANQKGLTPYIGGMDRERVIQTIIGYDSQNKLLYGGIAPITQTKPVTIPVPRVPVVGAPTIVNVAVPRPASPTKTVIPTYPITTVAQVPRPASPTGRTIVTVPQVVVPQVAQAPIARVPSPGRTTTVTRVASPGRTVTTINRVPSPTRTANIVPTIPLAQPIIIPTVPVMQPIAASPRGTNVPIPVIPAATGGATTGYNVPGLATKVVDTPTGQRLINKYDGLTNSQLLETAEQRGITQYIGGMDREQIIQALLVNDAQDKLTYGGVRVPSPQTTNVALPIVPVLQANRVPSPGRQQVIASPGRTVVTIPSPGRAVVANPSPVRTGAIMTPQNYQNLGLFDLERLLYERGIDYGRTEDRNQLIQMLRNDDLATARGYV